MLTPSSKHLCWRQNQQQTWKSSYIKGCSAVPTYLATTYACWGSQSNWTYVVGQFE
jgi:hypothetical protein